MLLRHKLRCPESVDIGFPTDMRHVKPSFPVLLGLAWALTAAVLLASRWPEMGSRLFDADDAMRLTQVRDFLSGHGWFNLHDVRVDPPHGYDTHWSRLIDLGLAALYLGFRPFTGGAMAESTGRWGASVNSRRREGEG